MLQVYFDSNMLFDVLGRRDGLFQRVNAGVAKGLVEVVVSDTNLLELFGGGDRPSFEREVERLLLLRPRWAHVAILTQRELSTEDAALTSGTTVPPLLIVEPWGDFLSHVATSDHEAVLPHDALIPTPEAFAALFATDTLKERMSFWRAELRAVRHRVAEEMAFVRTRRNFYWKTVAYTLRRNFKSTSDLVDLLWGDADRAPAFRIDFELTMNDLDRHPPKWTTNNFIDHVHARLLPYVHIFVTRDGPFLEKLRWFDKAVRSASGLVPYGTKICDDWSTVEAQLR